MKGQAVQLQSQSGGSRLTVVCRSEGRIARYGAYLVQIIRSEGFRPQQVIELGGGAPASPANRSAALESTDVLVLAATLVDKQTASLLAEWVHAGGRLIALRPSATLRRELGINTTARSAERYRAVPTEHRYARALIGTTLAGLTIADVFDSRALPESASAALATSDSVKTPLVFEFSHGAGAVVVFAFDLAHTVARLRQGNPDRVDTLSLGSGAPLRPTDLLEGMLEPEAWRMPQADLLTGLLANAIIGRSGVTPRVWYFPKAELGTIAVQDSDDDWSTQEQFDCLINSAESFGVRLSFYLMGGSTPTVLTPPTVTAMRARGHSFGIHHDGTDRALDGEDAEFTLDRVVRTDLDSFADRFGGQVLVNRNHCIIWKGFVDLPRLYAERGLIMEFNYENHVNAWHGFMAGSARPLKYVDETGEVIDVYQQSTHIFDDELIKERLRDHHEEEVELFRELVLRSRDWLHGPVVMQSHPLSFAGYSQRYFEGCWQTLNELGVPIVSAEAWALFVRDRDRVELELTETDAGTTLRVSGDLPAAGLGVAIPDVGRRITAVRFGTVSVPVRRKRLSGVEHAMFDWPAEQDIFEVSLVKDGSNE